MWRLGYTLNRKYSQQLEIEQRAQCYEMERKCNTLASILPLFLLFSFAGRSTAQVDDGGTDTTMIIAISLPFAIFFVATVSICIVFWWCYCRVSTLAKQPHYRRRPRYVYNYPRAQQNVQPPQIRATSNGQPHSTETVVSSSTNLDPIQTIGGDSTTTQSTALNPPHETQDQAYSGQGCVSPPTVMAPSTSPGDPARSSSSSSQTVPQATSEPAVSLPEATLHQGDAPPGYAEAIGMKTVIVMDET